MEINRMICNVLTAHADVNNVYPYLTQYEDK